MRSAAERGAELALVLRVDEGGAVGQRVAPAIADERGFLDARVSPSRTN
jgi:hypothetical protein